MRNLTEETQRTRILAARICFLDETMSAIKGMKANKQNKDTMLRIMSAPHLKDSWLLYCRASLTVKKRLMDIIYNILHGEIEDFG